MNNKLMEVTDNIGIVTDDIGKMWAVSASSGKDTEEHMDYLQHQHSILLSKSFLVLEKEKLY